jgi:hypothetical protein
VLYCSICGLTTRVIDQVHERELEKIQNFGAVLGCKAETVAMRDEAVGSRRGNWSTGSRDLPRSPKLAAKTGKVGLASQ